MAALQHWVLCRCSDALSSAHKTQEKDETRLNMAYYTDTCWVFVARDRIFSVRKGLKHARCGGSAPASDTTYCFKEC